MQKLTTTLTIALLVCSLMVSLIGGLLVVKDKEKYKEKLITSIAKELEKTGVTGNSFKLDDFTANITRDAGGRLFEGNCTFYDGFVSRIEEMTGPHYENQLQYDYVNKTHIELGFHFHLVKLHTIFYLDYTFTDFHDTGTIELRFDTVDFRAYLFKAIDGEKVDTELEFYTMSGDFQIAVRAYPYHEYMQVIAYRKPVYKEMIRASFKKWEGIFGTFLKKAVEEADFPEVCYNC